MILEKYKKEFEAFLALTVANLSSQSALKEAVCYALQSGGKRLRPILVMVIAKALGSVSVMPAALSVEYFHTASLIADDLPCMDNDAERRGKPSLHVAFGESTALLASYTLIALGYGGIHENAKLLQQDSLLNKTADLRALVCLDVVTKNAGLEGATFGQFLDLFPQEPSWDNLLTLIEKKTATLFEIAFVFGWVFGGGDLTQIPEVKKCAKHLGLAFQIVDDLEDDHQDAKMGRGMNVVAFLGKEKALQMFTEEVLALQENLEVLKIFTQPFKEIIQMLVARCGLLAV